jgi:integrase/recombinase XerD
VCAEVGFLRGLGVAPPAPPATVANATDRLLAAFEEHLLGDRGLVEVMVAGYRRVATSFLAGRFPDGDLRLEQLTAADVSAFMLGQSGGSQPRGSLSTTVTGLRALLRFLFVRGYTPLSLAAAGARLRAASPRRDTDALSR